MANLLREILAHARNPQLYAQLEAVRHKAFHAAELEAARARNAMQAEAVRAEAAYRQSQIDHGFRLAELDRELQNKIELAGFQSLAGNADALAELKRSVAAAALEDVRARSAVRGEVFKSVMGAVVQERIAKAAHARQMELERLRHAQEMEKLAAQSAEQRATAYFDRLCGYVLAMVQAGREREAEAEVGAVLARAAAAGL